MLRPLRMENTVYLVNSTPKYYFMLPLHFALLRRYAPHWKGGVVLATEEPEHPICQKVHKEYGVELLRILEEDAGFLDSRRAALRLLQKRALYDTVLPMQEDFLLDRSPDWGALDVAEQTLHRGVASVRLMPCPGPAGDGLGDWIPVTPTADTYGFTFQATLWRLDSCLAWYERICDELERKCPRARTDPKKRVQVEVGSNLAENAEGQGYFWEMSAERGETHVGWKRRGPQPNAVYLSPWPYRPTAIVRGAVEGWASELARREGVPL